MDGMARRALQSLVPTLAVLVCARIAAGQLPGGPVRQDSGPIRELSTNAGDGSGSVRGSGRGLRDDYAGPLSGNSVRGSVSRNVLSGPIGDISAGPVTAGLPVSGRGTVTDSSAGAVTKDVDSPLRERIAEPVHGLEPLQQRLRAIQPLPREDTPAQETELIGGATLPGEQVEADEAAVPRVTAQPNPQVEGEAEAMHAATESAEPAAAAPDEQADSPEAE
jgi:hypothetical protein